MKKNMIKVEESFENVFDSSLIDYSSDFEKQDEHYKRIKQIKDWIDTYCVSINMLFKHNNKPDYIINDDYTIDVYNSFYIKLGYNDNDKRPLVDGQLPDYIKFNKCEGSFSACGDIYQLKTLKGFPNYIDGDLDLRNNNWLVDLKGCPDIITGDLNLTGCTYYLTDIIKKHGGYPCGWAEYKNYKILHEKYGFPLFGLDAYLYGGSSNIYIPSDKNVNVRFSKSILIHNYKKGMEEENKQNMNESFENVFDSSLVDYSKDFEEQDKQYKINQIKEWIQNNILITGNKGIGVRVYNPYLHPALLSDNYYQFWKFFKINDDYSIDIINPYSDSTSSFTAEIFPMEWSPSYITLKGRNSPEYSFSKVIGTLKELPEYIKFNKCEGNFKIDNVKIESLQRFPEYVYGSVFIRGTNIRTLKGGPIMVTGNYTIEDNHELCNFSGAPLECNSFNWKDYNKEYRPATNAVFPRYEDGKLINKEQVNNTRYLY